MTSREAKSSQRLVGRLKRDVICDVDWYDQTQFLINGFEGTETKENGSLMALGHKNTVAPVPPAMKRLFC